MSAFEIKFCGASFDDVKVRIQEFAFNHLGMHLKMKIMPKRGRPKMSREEHLGGYDKRDDQLYKELEALLTQVYERLGPSIALQALNKCGCQKLSDLEETEYERLSRLLKDYLSNS